MEKIISELKEKQNIRNNLSSLRALIKDEEQLSILKSMVGNEDTLWLSFLKNEDAKTSKNVLIAMLEELIKRDSAEAKKKKLEEKYDIAISTNMVGYGFRLPHIVGGYNY